MDLVDYDQEVFDGIRDEFDEFATRLDMPDLTFIPISALHGDNVVDRSEKMPWYEGSTLLHHLEEVHIGSDRNLVDVRFPVQYVIRPQSSDQPDYRGYAGHVAGGVFKPGDDVMVLPSGFTSTIASIDTYDGPLEEAYRAGVGHHPARRRDRHQPGRHDLPPEQPAARRARTSRRWSAGCPRSARLKSRDRLAIKHTTNGARAMVKELRYRLDINTLHRDEEATELEPQRDRPRPAADDPAAVLRRVPPQPDDGQLHPDRRGDQRHSRRRDDHRLQLSGPPGAGCRAIAGPTRSHLGDGAGRPRASRSTTNRTDPQPTPERPWAGFRHGVRPGPGGYG